MQGNALRKVKTFIDEEAIRVIPTSNARLSEYVYYEAQRRNNTTEEVPATYLESRYQALLDCPCMYKMAVLRIETEGINIPMWIGGEKNLEVTMFFEPDNITTTRTVDIPVGIPIFNTSVVVDYINQALTLAYNDMVAAYDAIYGPGAWVANPNVAQSPFGLIYDPTTELFSYYSPLENERSLPNAIDLILNTEMYLLFSGNYFDPVYSTLPGNLNEHLMIFDAGYGNSNIVTIDGVEYVRNLATFSTDDLWHDVKQIVLVSDTLGCRPVQIGTNAQVGTPANQNIILDFDVVLNNSVLQGPASRVGLTPFNYRWTDLTGNQPLVTISFTLYARKRNQTLIPLTLLPGRSFSVLVLFAKTVTT